MVATPMSVRDCSPTPHSRGGTLPVEWASSLSGSLYGSSRGSVVAFFNSPAGASVYWPSHGSGSPQPWPRTNECVPPHRHSPWLGTTAVCICRNKKASCSPPPSPPFTSPSASTFTSRLARVQQPAPGFANLQSPPSHTTINGMPFSRNLRTPLRHVGTPGERGRDSLSGPLTARPMRVGPSPVAARLLHAHPLLDGSSTDNADTAPRSSKARARRLAAHLHRMPRGSDLTV